MKKSFNRLDTWFIGFFCGGIFQALLSADYAMAFIIGFLGSIGTGIIWAIKESKELEEEKE